MLSAQELADIRADIGDTATPSAFTDAEIQRAWERVAGAPDTATRESAVRGLLIRQLLMSAAKLNDYTAGATSEKRSQVFDQLGKMFEMFKAALDSALNVAPPATQKAAIRPAGRRGRTYPSDVREGDW